MIILIIIELTQKHPKQKHTLVCQLSCIVALLGLLVSSCQRTGSLKTIAFSKVLNFRNCFLNEGAYNERWLKPLYFTPSFKWFCNLMTNVSLLTTSSNFWALQWSTLSSLFISCLLFSGVYYKFAFVYFKVCTFGSNSLAWSQTSYF